MQDDCSCSPLMVAALSGHFGDLKTNARKSSTAHARVASISARLCLFIGQRISIIDKNDLYKGVRRAKCSSVISFDTGKQF